MARLPHSQEETCACSFEKVGQVIDKLSSRVSRVCVCVDVSTCDLDNRFKNGRTSCRPHRHGLLKNFISRTIDVTFELCRDDRVVAISAEQ